MELDKFNPLLTTIRPMSTSSHSPYEYQQSFTYEYQQSFSYEYQQSLIIV
jgi:hypothetical protein